MSKREALEFFLPKIAIGLVVIGVIVYGISLDFKQDIVRGCAKAEEMLESFARCEAHVDCSPTRDDMSVLIKNESYIERRCGEDETL